MTCDVSPVAMFWKVESPRISHFEQSVGQLFLVNQTRIEQDIPGQPRTDYSSISQTFLAQFGLVYTERMTTHWNQSIATNIILTADIIVDCVFGRHRSTNKSCTVSHNELHSSVLWGALVKLGIWFAACMPCCCLLQPVMYLSPVCLLAYPVYPLRLQQVLVKPRNTETMHWR